MSDDLGELTADHDWFVEDREYARQEARRGRRHAYESLDPRRTALVVVDVVPFFVRGSAYVRGIVPRVNRVATALRGAGGVVAWVVPAYAPPTSKDREFPGSSGLPALLAARRIDTLLVAGTVTNVCVEDTVRDASTSGLRVILVADACAATRDRDHNSTLHVVYRSYGDVRPTSEVLELVEAGRRQVASS